MDYLILKIKSVLSLQSAKIKMNYLFFFRYKHINMQKILLIFS